VSCVAGAQYILNSIDQLHIFFSGQFYTVVVITAKFSGDVN